MKKFLFLLLIFFIFIGNLNVIHAQNILDLDKSLPGIGCGVAQTGDDREKCCSIKPGTLSLPSFGGPVKYFATNIPVLGAIVDLYLNTADNVNKKVAEMNSFINQNPNTACVYGIPNPNPGDPSCRCEATASARPIRAISEMCYKYLIKSSELKECLNCTSKESMWTGIGCVPLNLQSFISNFLLSIGIGFAGIIALLCIIYSAFIMQTSSGNPERIKKAQENLTSCILGLMLIIFAVFILRLIGVDILRIPFIK